MSGSNSGDKVVSRPMRRKVSVVRAWERLSGAGERDTVEVGREVIMRLTGLATRDLRILDPVLSYPSTILGRERAMVIKLEHIKAIITAQEVLLLKSEDPSLIPFVQQLQKRILRHHRATQPRDQNGEDNAERKKNDIKILPFEFVALDACLETACSELEDEANILEQEAHPALDSLTSDISTLNLERVRQIKSRLVDITSRVRKVRDELEQLLDDDEDMAELYLTHKLVQQQLENSTSSSMNDADDTVNQVLQPELNDRICPEISLEPGGGSGSDEDLQNAAEYSRDQMFGASNIGISSNTHGTQAATTYSAETNKLDSEELEMLLGAYFVQTGGILNKLFTLREYVEDTEDYINVMLDDKRNRLLQMSIKLHTTNLFVNAFAAVTGVFAINIHIDLYDTGLPQFLWTIFGCTAICIFLFIVVIACYKRRGLLE